MFVGLQGKNPPPDPSPSPQRSGRHVGEGGSTHSHTARAAPSRGFAFGGRDGRVRVNPQMCAGFCARGSRRRWVTVQGELAGVPGFGEGTHFAAAQSSGLWGEMGPGRAPHPPPVHPKSSCCGYRGCAGEPAGGLCSVHGCVSVSPARGTSPAARLCAPMSVHARDAARRTRVPRLQP